MTARGSLACVLLLVAAACSSPASRPAGPAAGVLVPTATQAGDPMSATTTAAFAPGGGTWSSADGALKLSVPGGAMAVSTEISITPIANMARGAVGPAFRLGPEGTTFAAPVTITLKAPDAFPAGVSFAGVGIEYQDARGFWHRVDPVARDAGARTVTVATTHFSDWALTFEGATAAAEGPITLVQTVGIPFTATGRATIYFQEDSATDTVYALTGTLTVPGSFTVDGKTCVPDQVTKTLPFNFAEVHKSEPPVFRWGIGVFWTLTCTAPGPVVTTELMPAMFDTMSINPPLCPADYLDGQIVSASQLSGTYTKDCGVGDTISATWDLRTCAPGLGCDPGVDCRLGLTACTAGIQSCADAGVAPDGTGCGVAGAGVCTGGACVE